MSFSPERFLREIASAPSRHSAEAVIDGYRAELSEMEPRDKDRLLGQVADLLAELPKLSAGVGGHDIARDAPATAIDWRTLEVAIVDALRRQGCPLHYRNGVAFVFAEFCDEQSGELLHQRQVANLEQLARDLAETLR